MTAKNEPMCKLTSIERLCSLNRKYSDTNIKCEDELTGRNSVTPWIKDKINISITIRK